MRRCGNSERRSAMTRLPALSTKEATNICRNRADAGGRFGKPAKQRHKAHRIWARLRDELPSFRFAEVTVRQYVQKRKQEVGARAAFVPQSYDSGQEASGRLVRPGRVLRLAAKSGKDSALHFCAGK
jgi:hypothetical protein